jgi:hypothetical protein
VQDYPSSRTIHALRTNVRKATIAGMIDILTGMTEVFHSGLMIADSWVHCAASSVVRLSAKGGKPEQDGLAYTEHDQAY